MGESLHTFLAGRADWYFRANDDSWINPSNLLSFIDQLELFVEPRTDIVFKGQAYMYMVKPLMLQGGDGLLMSRAAAEFVASLGWENLTRQALHHQEDTAYSLAIFKALGEPSHWCDSRFTGATTGYRTQWIMPPVIRAHLPNRFSSFDRACRSTMVLPLRTAVGMHTAGLPEFEELITLAHELPDRVAMEWNGRTYDLCVAEKGTVGRLQSLQRLVDMTPIVSGQDIDRDVSRIAACVLRPANCSLYEGKVMRFANRRRGHPGSWQPDPHGEAMSRP
jgi:hypothetical protein